MKSFFVNLFKTVAELNHVELAGYETDLGLLPGGKIKLLKSSQINLNNLIRFLLYLSKIVLIKLSKLIKK